MADQLDINGNPIKKKPRPNPKQGGLADKLIPKDKVNSEGIIIEHGDPSKQAFVNILEFVTNTFYKTEDNNEITVQLAKAGLAEFYDTERIVLLEGLVDAYGDLGLPRFMVYYHELGHHLYSQGYFELFKKWMKITDPQSPIQFNKKYEHLANWIEDYYVEDKTMREHAYLTDVLTCLKKVPPEYDINKIEYAFNFWYIYGAPSPALSYTDQLAFKAYVVKLLKMRSTTLIRFGYGILTTLSIKHSHETKYVQLLIEFYNWCVSKKIFPKDKPMPKLSNPNGHLDDKNPPPKGNGRGGDDHSRNVGKNLSGYQERFHVAKPTTIFKDEVAGEANMIRKEMLDMSQRLQADNSTLDGLFSTKHKDSAIIQPRVIIPNFFNPNRIVDQVLFKQKEHSYMNVAMYRDVSGSTSGPVHRLMHKVCEKLHEDIPVDITYYLYASGKISIIEMPYIPWEYDSKVPAVYSGNPLFKKLGGGTNSDAIADVVTQQLSEKWLNIIITDGDLDKLMARGNIKALLKNVFVVSVGHEVEPGLLGIRVDSEDDIENINSVLSTINLNR